MVRRAQSFFRPRQGGFRAGACKCNRRAILAPSGQGRNSSLLFTSIFPAVEKRLARRRASETAVQILLPLPQMHASVALHSIRCKRLSRRSPQQKAAIQFSSLPQHKRAAPSFIHSHSSASAERPLRRYTTRTVMQILLPQMQPSVTPLSALCKCLSRQARNKNRAQFSSLPQHKIPPFLFHSITPPPLPYLHASVPMLIRSEASCTLPHAPDPPRKPFAAMAARKNHSSPRFLYK